MRDPFRRADLVECYDYRVDPTPVFLAQAPHCLALRLLEDCGRQMPSHVLWDPLSNEDGLMMKAMSEETLRADFEAHARDQLDLPESPLPRRREPVQKALQPVLSWCVERFFPTGAFYGRLYLRHLQADIKLPDKWDTPEMSCAMFLAARIRERGAEKAQFTASNTTSSGVEIGAWRITVEKIN